MTEPEEQAIATVVALAKVNQGAPSSIEDVFWKLCARLAISMKPSGSEAEHAAQVCFQEACEVAAAAATKDVDDETGGEIVPPPIAETAASNLIYYVLRLRLFIFCHRHRHCHLHGGSVVRELWGRELGQHQRDG